MDKKKDSFPIMYGELYTFIKQTINAQNGKRTKPYYDYICRKSEEFLHKWEGNDIAAALMIAYITELEERKKNEHDIVANLEDLNPHGEFAKSMSALYVLIDSYSKKLSPNYKASVREQFKQDLMKYVETYTNSLTKRFAIATAQTMISRWHTYDAYQEINKVKGSIVLALPGTADDRKALPTSKKGRGA